MTDKNKRNSIIKFRVNENEKRYILEKFKLSKTKSLSDFIRKEVVFGKVVYIDEKHLEFLKRQLAGACTNINQIAHMANSKRNVSAEQFLLFAKNRKRY